MTNSSDSKFSSGAVRSADASHLDFTSIPLIGLIGVARTAAEGAAKYGRLNYMLGMPVHDLLNHAITHIVMHTMGDRSEPHLSHAAWGLMAAVQSEALKPELSAPHMLGPGATLTPENIAYLDANKADLAARRKAGEFASAGDWKLNEIPQVAKILGAVPVASPMEAKPDTVVDSMVSFLSRETNLGFDFDNEASAALKERLIESDLRCPEPTKALTRALAFSKPKQFANELSAYIAELNLAETKPPIGDEILAVEEFLSRR